MSFSTAAQVRRALKAEANPEKAAFFPRFFKTGPGEYGEGDRFHGVTVPKCRRVARKAREIADPELTKLLASPFHEEREVALFILVDRFRHTNDAGERRRIYDFYVRHRRFVNNWDLVDGSAPAIVGGFLENRDRSQLYRWARSRNLWDRRIAMLATFHFIKKGDFDDALGIAAVLLTDEEDLIHKAVGWMLREVGKKDHAAQERFLETHYRKMPRTMLRYAIEKLPEARRQAYLKGRI
ncbi:MAG TPA: DNA alkylation repair protein [Vicinamibacteria bacterium]|nr:DNA alkylation repair protein [Vicinamibacteria bacterium]